jgi:hypothetical protein
MMDEPVNLQPLRRSRRRPVEGDVFAMHPPDGRYLFGRVIGAELSRERAPIEGAYLLYVYDLFGDSIDVDPSTLTKNRLLLAPTYTNRLGWVRGYFQTISHRPLRPDDILDQHCFWDALREKHVDECGRILAHPTEPCGEWAMASYVVIDDKISDALGIPRAPERLGRE